MHRQLVIDTVPPGAIVEVNGETLGPAPRDYPFTYYGTYHVRLIKDGFQTQVVKVPVDAPWYQYPPLDFITENLLPWTFRDIRRLRFDMQPLQPVPPDVILQRSQEFRHRGRSVGAPVAPAPGAIVPGPGLPPGIPPGVPSPSTPVPPPPQQ